MVIKTVLDFDLSLPLPCPFTSVLNYPPGPVAAFTNISNILLSSTDKIKAVNNYHLLQASNKPAGGETAWHQDTRAVSGGTPAVKLNMHRKDKRFLGKYSITMPIKDTGKSRSDFRRLQNIIPPIC